MKNTFFCLLLIFLAVAILATAYFAIEPGADDSDESDKMDTSSSSVSESEVDPTQWELIFEGTDSAEFDAVDQLTAAKYRFIGTGTKQGEYYLTIDLIGTDGEDDLVDVMWIDAYLEMDSMDPALVPYVPFDFTVELDLSDYEEGDQVTHFIMNDQTVEYSTLKIYRYIE